MCENLMICGIKVLHCPKGRSRLVQRNYISHNPLSLVKDHISCEACSPAATQMFSRGPLKVQYMLHKSKPYVSYDITYS